MQGVYLEGNNRCMYTRTVDFYIPMGVHLVLVDLLLRLHRCFLALCPMVAMDTLQNGWSML